MPRTVSKRDQARVLAVVHDLPISRRPTDAEIDNVLAYHADHPVPTVAEPRVAYVNHGRWVADCKMLDPLTGELCYGAEEVAPGEPFVCGTCHQQSPVVFPTAKTRKEIDRLLAVRPMSNQNWYVDEDVAVLVGENIARGLEA